SYGNTTVTLNFDDVGHLVNISSRNRRISACSGRQLAIASKGLSFVILVLPDPAAQHVCIDVQAPGCLCLCITLLQHQADCFQLEFFRVLLSCGHLPSPVSGYYSLTGLVTSIQSLQVTTGPLTRMQTKMMKLTFGTLFLVAFLGASPAYSVADESYRIKVGEGKYTPRNPPDVSFENDHWFVLPRYDDGNVDILVYDRGNQKSLINEIRLEYAWSQVNAILETPNHNLIVESLVSPVASEIAIISTARKSGSPYIDKFLTYRP